MQVLCRSSLHHLGHPGPSDHFPCYLFHSSRSFCSRWCPCRSSGRFFARSGAITEHTLKSNMTTEPEQLSGPDRGRPDARTIIIIPMCNSVGLNDLRLLIFGKCQKAKAGTFLWVILLQEAGRKERTIRRETAG